MQLLLQPLSIMYSITSNVINNTLSISTQYHSKQQLRNAFEASEHVPAALPSDDSANY